MKTAVILAAGMGTRIWPYGEIRPKAMIPVANRPIGSYLVDALTDLGFEDIIIAGGKHYEQIANYFRNVRHVRVVFVNEVRGTAFTLQAVKSLLQEDRCLVLFGDTYIEKADLQRFIEEQHTASDVAALAAPFGKENCQDWICCNIAGNQIQNIEGHPRDGFSHYFCCFLIHKRFFQYLDNNAKLFTSVGVGSMPPSEGYMEMSLVDYMQDGNEVPCTEATGLFMDLDKPWHILKANRMLVKKLCGQLSGNILEDEAAIDPSALLDGFVKLGKNSKIGRNVIIKGNVIVGDHTVIENGAILDGDVIIGDNCYVGNYCYVSDGTTIGNKCVVNHCAELAGMIMDGVYLYHYMEICGIVGMSTDIGAATVCGSLRFDDGNTVQKIKNRREYPPSYANATYIGDYARTGVNAIIMPGCKTGVYSIIGPGVILEEDLPNRKLVQVKQQLVMKDWGPEKYGW